MNAKVEDPMGLETGIRIDMVRTVLDKAKGSINIHGRMTACTRSVLQDQQTGHVHHLCGRCSERDRLG